VNREGEQKRETNKGDEWRESGSVEDSLQ